MTYGKWKSFHLEKQNLKSQENLVSHGIDKKGNSELVFLQLINSVGA